MQWNWHAVNRWCQFITTYSTYIQTFSCKYMTGVLFHHPLNPCFLQCYCLFFLSLFLTRLFHPPVLSLINLKMTRATPQLLSSRLASPRLASPRLTKGPWKGQAGWEALRIVGGCCHFEPLSHTPLTLFPHLFRQAFLLSLAGEVENGKSLLLCYLFGRLTAGFKL